MLKEATRLTENKINENSKNNNDILLEVVGLKKYFDVSNSIFKKNKKVLTAVDGLNFYIRKGETLGLVGESGCGKTTTGRTIIKLYEPTGGKIIFDGKDITKLTVKEMLPYRKRMQIIFQDPYASLNGRMTVTDIVGEGIDTHKLYEGKKRQER
ncbi:MAG: ATP-binding cassette domain-containing protein, partial [Clostridiales bacterium]|nr:ATP-binding cassette domain-containing protein [Clostridiales bacterium]